MRRRVEWTNEEIARFWDYQATRASSEQNYFSASRGRWIAHQTRKYVSRIPHPSILDVGCGKGHFLEHLSNAFAGTGTLSGCDFSAESIDAASQRLSGRRNVDTIALTDGMTLPFPDASFDVAYSIEVVEHLDEQTLRQYLAQCARVLRPGGLLVVTTPNSEDLEKLETCCPSCDTIFHIWQHVRRFEPAGLRDTLRESGFSTLACAPTFFGSPVARAALSLAHRTGMSKRGDPHLLGVFSKDA